MRLITGLVMGTFLTIVSVGFSQTINLVEGTLAEQPICALELDQLTGLLGRPSAVDTQPEFLASIIGPTLYYHPLGIRVQFRGGDRGEQRVLATAIYLTRAWDEEHTEWYQAFGGHLIPEVSPNWTARRTLEELASHKPEERTPDQLRQEVKETGVPESAIPDSFDYVVRVSKESYGFAFMHEPTTRFLERANFICGEQD
jgi:hypothetical protein